MLLYYVRERERERIMLTSIWFGFWTSTWLTPMSMPNPWRKSTAYRACVPNQQARSEWSSSHVKKSGGNTCSKSTKNQNQHLRCFNHKLCVHVSCNNHQNCLPQLCDKDQQEFILRVIVLNANNIWNKWKHSSTIVSPEFNLQLSRSSHLFPTLGGQTHTLFRPKLSNV